MRLVVYQSIVIHHLRVDSVANSSVLQIGTSGTIRSLSNLYNTGGYLAPAPELAPQYGYPSPVSVIGSQQALVPFAPPD